MATPLLTAAEMQAVDRAAIEEIGIPSAVLMEQAGRACAEEAERLVRTGRPARVAVLVGKGNNGGDGLVAARYLRSGGHQVDVFLLAEPSALKGDPRLNLGILERLGHPVHACPDEAAVRKLDLSGYDVILDALFGTGLERPVGGHLALAIEAMNKAAAPVVAVDLPSGISADTGQVLGVAVQATCTVTFGAPKRGHLLYPGALHTGDLIVADIGFPPELFKAGPGATFVLDDDDALAYLEPRRPDAHKGHFGHLLVVAGSEDKPGAAGLCCRAALRAGAGLVTLGAPPAVLARVIVGPTEAMGLAIDSEAALRSAMAGKSAIAIGPGLGQDPLSAGLVRTAVAEADVPVVVDADGLNNLVGCLELVQKARGARILTPHPGEMGRLLGIATADVQRDRFGAARKLACDLGSVVVLKGASTLVADPDGTTYLVPTGNPGMATGGTGDVLTGVIGALLCQGLAPIEAASVGAYLHGAAGDLVARRLGQRGLIASDVVEALPEVVCGRRAAGDEG